MLSCIIAVLRRMDQVTYICADGRFVPVPEPLQKRVAYEMCMAVASATWFRTAFEVVTWYIPWHQASLGSAMCNRKHYNSAITVLSHVTILEVQNGISCDPYMLMKQTSDLPSCFICDVYIYI